ncbi:MAG: hypothetical protein CEO12_113 [Parcubacteria group bacterium Gr01-1014_46]|nr:MAG: hypothetical protein CEO12_113 [Parcubacteria group bacterium Gr01-1014_46]
MRVVIRVANGHLDWHFPFSCREEAGEYLKEKGLKPSGFQKDVWIFGEPPNAIPARIIEFDSLSILDELFPTPKPLET